MEDYKTWKIGDEVECVDDSDFRFTFGENIPIKGTKYTIRSFVYYSGGVGIRLNEIQNKPMLYDIGGFAECAFHAWRFRKLQKRKTDISVFTQMLNQTELTNKIELEIKERIKDVV